MAVISHWMPFKGGGGGGVPLTKGAQKSFETERRGLPSLSFLSHFCLFLPLFWAPFRFVLFSWFLSLPRGTKITGGGGGGFDFVPVSFCFRFSKEEPASKSSATTKRPQEKPANGGN